MTEERVQRRLAAILAADAVGYSRLMGTDEAGTRARFNAHLRDLIEPAIANRRGRVVKTTGDGLLVEFASVVDAVECAVDIQNGMADRNADEPTDQRIVFRIGVNLGDVIIEGDDIHGDGVNVAARLQALAEPGGICVSADVQRQAGGKVDFGFEDLGAQDVKNIAEPVRVYRILPEGGQHPVSPVRPASQMRSAVIGIAAVVAAALVAGGLYSWSARHDTGRPSQTGQAEARLSIAVLPFQNLSQDPDQDYFADGMAEDIITDLSRLSALFVVARNSSFRYKDRSVDVKQIGRELGAKYLLEGSVRRAGDQVRINAQLIDAETGAQVWAERYDGLFANTFDLQDKVTGRIIDALSLRLDADERARLADRGTNNFEAHDAFLKGQSYARQYTSEGFALAIAQLERALELDPGYNRAAAAIEQIRYIREKSGLQ